VSVDARNLDVDIDASYVKEKTLSGAVKYASEQFTFTSSFQSAYDLMPTLGAIAGTYDGTAAVGVGPESTGTACFDASANVLWSAALNATGTSGFRFGACKVQAAYRQVDGGPPVPAHVRAVSVRQCTRRMNCRTSEFSSVHTRCKPANAMYRSSEFASTALAISRNVRASAK
jgi:hypothetical protein